MFKGAAQTMEWKEETLIPTHIEVVWKIFQDQNAEKLFPNVTEQKLIEGEENSIGAKYLQTYMDGKRTSSYVVETVLYWDEPDRKEKKMSFQSEEAFQITQHFYLIKLNENETQLIYKGEKKPVNFKGKLLLKLMAKRDQDCIVQKTVQRIREAAEV